LAAIGSAADQVSRRLHPEPYRTYNVDRNINYTNICTAVCNFCAFYRGPKSDEGYVLPRPVLLQKVKETANLGGNQILLQGGCIPSSRSIGTRRCWDIKRSLPDDQYPRLQPAGAASLHQGQQAADEVVLQRLKDAGLGSIPGGGAEILVDRVRSELTRGKVMSDDWLNVMRVWHRNGRRAPRR
jgi:cyclic dehypoxanthinyl futalosine synthase